MNIRTGKSRFLLVMLFATAFVGSSAWAAIDQASVDKCKTCHEDVVTNFLKGAHHGKAFVAGDKQNSCESCHGSGEKHIAAGGGRDSIISFGKKSVQNSDEQSKQCLGCHAKFKSLLNWEGGKHQANDVACASCHSIHGDKNKQKNPETCFACHKDVASDAKKMSHHPIIEGKIGCYDCHNPHGSMSHGNLKADNINQLCYKCHADKRGPFLWEHPPVEENCGTCHFPHGSSHMKLLTENQPGLCQDCHDGYSHPGNIWDANNGFGKNTPAGKTSSRFVGRSCMNCHSAIHGSNAAGSSSKSGKRFWR